MKQIKGLFTALVTPFQANGAVDEEALRRLIHFQVNADVDGLLILGSTGEAPTLTEKEKKRIIQLAREELDDRVHLMVGTGSYSTQQAIENSLMAQELGADSVLVVTPYYNKPTQEGIYLHFKEISNSIKIPLMVYNIEGRTCRNIEIETLKRIADLPHICGVKESSGKLDQFMDCVSQIGQTHPHFSIMSGDDPHAVPHILMGGDGIISVVGNLIPSQMKELVQKAFNFESEAMRIHYQLSLLFKAAFIETNPAPIKAAMNYCGMDVGGCRLPLSPLSEKSQQLLIECLDSKITQKQDIGKISAR